jgi:hypothetical protein
VGEFWLTASQERASEGARFDIDFRFQASIKRIDRVTDFESVSPFRVEFI